MEASNRNLSTRILHLTLEIIYLLTGAENIVAKQKLTWDGQKYIMVSLESLLKPERKNEKNILQVNQKITDLLMKEMQRQTDNVLKEWVSLQGYKYRFNNLVMENQPLLTSQNGSSSKKPPETLPRPLYSWNSTQEHQEIPQEDQVAGPSNMNPPERCPRPLYSRDSTQEHQEIPQEDQVAGSSNMSPLESCPQPLYSWDSTHEHQEIPQNDQVDGSSNVRPQENCPHPLYSQDSIQEEITIHRQYQGVDVFDFKNDFDVEDMYTIGNMLSMKADEMMTFAQPESTLNVNAGHSAWNTPEECLILSAHYNDNGMAQSSPAVSTVTEKLHDQLNHMVRSIDFSADSNDKSHAVIPNPQASVDIVEKSPDPSNPGASSLDNLHNFQDCEKTLEDDQDLVIPQNSQTSKHPFSCSMCDKSFTRRAKLERHLRVHTGEKPYWCGECKVCFTDKESCEIHLRTHAKEPFTCSVCGKGFAHKMVLTVHQRTHTS
ncbi:uncharacterized protein ACMZJ9_015414 [Mantella aurantiaca]